MLDAERLSLAAIAFSSSRSSLDNRITTGFFEAIPLGNRDRLICSSCAIMLYCDPLSYVSTIIEHKCGQVNTEFLLMTSIGERLKEIRSSMGLNQTDFATLVGYSRNAQAHYERDERSPDAKYLSALASIGIDVMYVLTGIKSELANITVEEQKLIEHYRAMSEVSRVNIQAVGSALAQSAPDKHVKKA